MTREEKTMLYTARWYTREKWGEPSAKEEVLDILSKLLDPDSTPAERPSVSQPGQKLLWCPFANTDFPRARSRGSYRNGYPKGAVVHFTAGRRNGLASGLEYQVSQGYLYFLIDEAGNIGQNFPLDSWGYHAGASSFPGLSGPVSNDLVGIEVQCAGKLAEQAGTYKSWFNTTIPAAEVRTISTNSANQVAGHYQKYTDAQETALVNLLVWLFRNNPDVFSLDFVVGHDEVSPGRKNDPGGALSSTMSDFRAKLRSLV
jgi:hypothetical protein